jgi:hypothetical protein
MRPVQPYRKALSGGAVTLLVACVLSHWAVSGTILQRLAETDHPRIKTLLGHEDWLDERGMFATPLRERVTWGILLLVLATSRILAAVRLEQNDFCVDAICTLLGVVIGVLLAFVSHILTYGAGMVLRGGIVASGALHSLVGLGGGLLLAGLATLLTRLRSKTDSGPRIVE